MKKINLFLIAVVLSLSILSRGQCPLGDVNLGSQSDIVEFSQNYPSCTDLDGDLYLSSEKITDVSVLSNITSIGGNLYVYETACEVVSLPNLVSVDGNLSFHQKHV